MTIKAIITGATGMVGEGVLFACLNHPDVEQVLVVNRKPGGVAHPKLREVIHADSKVAAPKPLDAYYRVPRPGLLWNGEGQPLPADGGKKRPATKTRKKAVGVSGRHDDGADDAIARPT